MKKESLKAKAVRLERERDGVIGQLKVAIEQRDSANKGKQTLVQYIRDADKRKEESKLPFRQLTVILADASGKPISQSMTHLNSGDEVEASVDHEGDIRIVTKNSQR